MIFNTDEAIQSTTESSAGSSKEETIPSVVSAEAKSKAKKHQKPKLRFFVLSSQHLFLLADDVII